MTLKRWFRLFISTLAWGMGTSCLVGFVLMTIDPLASTATWWYGLPFNLLGMLIIGATLGAFSHMGFFAYLTVQMIGLGILRRLWPYVQVTLTVLACMYTLILHNPLSFADMMQQAIMPSILILGALPVTWLKAKQTNRSAVIPSLFLLIAVTLLESAPALRQNNAYAIAMMVAPLFVCNAWQLLRLHRIVTPKEAPMTTTPNPTPHHPQDTRRARRSSHRRRR